MHFRLSLCLFMALLMLCFFNSTYAAGDDDTQLVVASLILPLSHAIPRIWLENDKYGNSLSYGNLRKLGDSIAETVIKRLQQHHSAEYSNERDKLIPDYLRSIKYHSTLDSNQSLRVTLFGADASTQFVWESLQGTLRSAEGVQPYDEIVRVIENSFKSSYSENLPVIPSDDEIDDEEDIVFPTDIKPAGAYIVVYRYPSTCLNGVKDGNETDIDCGGDDCPACFDVQGQNACLVSDDCTFGYSCSEKLICVSDVAPNYDDNASPFVTISAAVIALIACAIFAIAM